MAFLSFLLTGGCSYEETLAVSGNGTFTFHYVGPYLYVADEGANFPSPDEGVIKIYDMSDPAGPELLSTTNTGFFTGPKNPRCFGNYLYVPCCRPLSAANATSAGVPGQTPKVQIYDVSNRSSPSLVGTYTIDTTLVNGLLGIPGSIDKIGNSLCVSIQNGASALMYKLDVTDPANPSLGDSITLSFGSGQQQWVTASNDHFFVTGLTASGGAAYCISVNASTFNEVDALSTGSGGLVAGRSVINSAYTHLYVQTINDSTIWTVDIDDPTNLASFSVVASGLGTTTQRSPLVLIEDTDRLYVGRTQGASVAIGIMDVSTPDTPVALGTISTSNETQSDMTNISDGCAGFAWGQGTGSAIHLLGTPATS